MADNDDWRAQRAAELAGTPFARPPQPPVRPTGTGDATLPIGRTPASTEAFDRLMGRSPAEPAAGSEPLQAGQAAVDKPRPAARAAVGALPPGAAAIGTRPATAQAAIGAPSVSPARGKSVLGWIAGVIIALACIAGAVLALRRPPSAPVARVPPPAPVAARPPRIFAPSPVAASLPVIVPAAPSQPVGPPAEETVRSLPRAADQEPSARTPVAKLHHKKTPTAAPAVAVKKADVRKRASTGHKSAVRHPSRIRPSDTATYTTSAVAAYVPYTAAKALPICQPDDYTRAPRPCRPSHNRVVRKPFFQN